MQLIDIQKLQFSNKPEAESKLLSFLQENEDPAITRVELQPKPESLNSMNGFVTYADGERLFFKTHVEESEKLSEYYNAERLAEAGYPVVSARQISHRPGKQIVLYEIVTYPTLFDVLKVEEDKLIAGASQDKAALSARTQQLIRAQAELDKSVFGIYERTLDTGSADDDAAAPIHQLFSNRLAEDGRLGLFYRGHQISAGGQSIVFDTLANLRWTINGVTYADSLNQIIERAQSALAPSAGPSIVGHGDAHNGNIFVDDERQRLLMFDPAFAGKHHPLLDITKPLFHNVFARWMYYPEQVVNEFSLTFDISDNAINIEHSFTPSALRRGFLESRINNVLKPTLQLLAKRDLLRSDWQTYLRSALFCCPFLTVNLFAPKVENGTLAERYELPIKLLGLATAVEFGASQHQGTSATSQLIDSLFD